MNRNCKVTTAPVAALARANHLLAAVAGTALLMLATNSFAQVRMVVGYHTEGQETASFTFTNLPAPSRNDAATAARFTIVTGEADNNSGGLEKLHDGKVPGESDEPAQNFFFAAGTGGGRIQVDLGGVRSIKQVNTYSWHPTSRGPQIYQLYASAGTADGFVARPGKEADLEKSGWKRIAQVDTRPSSPIGGGQCGVSVFDPTGAIGDFRYFLFDILPTETGDNFGNTFYSEIDVVESNVPAEPVESNASAPIVVRSADGYCDITIDTAREPALAEWAQQQLAPTLAAWYPKIVAMLASDGFNPPKKISVVLRPGDGVAYTTGTRIVANSVWLGGELKGEALGALIHEVVHVVQQYSGGRNKDRRAPAWLVEGIPDYIRFFKYEPQSHGADLVWLRGRKKLNLSYDGMYRISANFLDYVVTQYDPDQKLIQKVNAACRQGNYTDELWRELTGKSLLDLNAEWKAAVQKQLAVKTETGLNLDNPAARCLATAVRSRF